MTGHRIKGVGFVIASKGSRFIYVLTMSRARFRVNPHSIVS